MVVVFKEHEKSLKTGKDLRGRFCARPFELMEIHREFFAFACCPSWVPQNIGNCETNDLMTVWNSRAARLIRLGVLDGSFRHCDHRACPEIQSGNLPRIEDLPEDHRQIVEEARIVQDTLPRQIALCYDDSCNLSCPSCRATKRLEYEGEGYERKIRFTERLMDQVLAQAEHHFISLRVTGSGDPIASKVFRHLLAGIDGRSLPRLRIILQTNATMLTPKVWQELAGIHGNVHGISISIDAAREATYAKVRRLGNWRQLMENIAFVNGLVADGTVPVLDYNFVVQTENFREMGDFVSLCRGFGPPSHINFSLVNDWGSWSREEYLRQCIWKTDHPEFSDFLAALRDPRLDDPAVDLGNVTAYRLHALGLDRPAEAQATEPRQGPLARLRRLLPLG